MKKELEHYEEVKSILAALIDEYVANKGTKNEFISCITPEKRMSYTWLLWTHAMLVLAKGKKEGE